MKNLQVTEKVQLSVGLKFTFMGVDLRACVHSEKVI